MDLNGGCVAIGGVDALQLRVPVFVEGISEVGHDALEETLSYGPHFMRPVPFLFHLFPGMSCSGVIYVGIISGWFGFLDPCKTCEMLVLLLVYDFG